MNNGEKEIAQMIKDIESEVINLKTAHQRPLGVLNFFKKSEQFTIPLTEIVGIYGATFNVIVKIAKPPVTPPIVQAGWDTPAGIFQIERIDMAISSDYSTYTYKLRVQANSAMASVVVKVGVTSSQPIESITAGVV